MINDQNIINKHQVKMRIAELLVKIIARLKIALNPEQIILFGSHAYGEPSEESDIDLLIVVANSNEPRYRRARQAYKVLQNIGVPIDVIVMTREEVERKLNVPSSLVSRIIHEGKLLYEA
ncbi:nucleotidyltransferase domain-containing protein [Cylindrospermopsis raciborskii]|nr:nucleotidyltransferase domain-containing protein [Cylindrospermopsis raciborskii]